jgi:MraZ protein
MFTGKFQHSLDQKNRVTIPKKFLEAISDPAERSQFFATLGLDTCLFLFTITQWNEIAAQVKKAAMATPGSRNFSRLFFASASRCDLDSAGRILIPDELRQRAELGKDVVFVGAWDRMELWDVARWEALQQDSAKDYTANAEEIFRRL